MSDYGYALAALKAKITPQAYPGKFYRPVRWNGMRLETVRTKWTYDTPEQALITAAEVLNLTPIPLYSADEVRAAVTQELRSLFDQGFFDDFGRADISDLADTLLTHLRQSTPAKPHGG